MSIELNSLFTNTKISLFTLVFKKVNKFEILVERMNS